MAAASTTFSFLLLLLLLLFSVSSLKIHARAVRESNFNDALRENNFDDLPSIDNNLPSPKEDDPTTTATFSPPKQNGYGIDGRGGYNVEYRHRHFPPKDFNSNGERNYDNKPQGMTDTSFSENGKYYYGVDSERPGRGYGSDRVGNSIGSGSTKYSNNYMGFGSGQVDSMKTSNNNNYNDNGGNGSNEFPYEYNSAVNRFQNRQERDEDFKP